MTAIDERFIRELAKAIDSDEPPGIAARNLARAVFCLVRDRSGADAVRLEIELNKLAFRFPRTPREKVEKNDG